MTDKIVSIQISKQYVGNRFAFDKIYFFRKENRDDIPRMFGHALVMSVDNKLLDALYTLEPKEWNRLHEDRHDDDLHVPIAAKQGSVDKYKKWWIKNVVTPFDLENRVAVIQILTKSKGEKLLPQYLASPAWFIRRSRQRYYSRRGRYTRSDVPKSADQRKTAIPGLSYIATPLAAPNDKLRPICVQCPQSLAHLQGACILGMPQCCKNLDLSQAGVDGTKAAPPTKAPKKAAKAKGKKTRARV